MQQDHSLYININKLSTFIFELKLKIDRSIIEGYVSDSQDCISLIELELIKSNNLYMANSNEGLINFRDQIFLFYFGEENNDIIPLIEKFKMLSLLN